MLFAHAPAGYLALKATEKFWNKVKFDKKRRIILYLVGILSAVFPDFDVIYYYLFSAESSHRTYFTHGFVFYIFIFLVIYIIGLIWKKRFIKSLAWVILIGSFSHLLLDMIASGITVFAPFSNWMIGMRSLGFVKNYWIGNNIFLVNYTLELLIIITALIVFLWGWAKERVYQIILIVSGLIIFILGSWGLVYVNDHIYAGDSFDLYFEDKDKDRIINFEDFDINGNGIFNIADKDANGNGKFTRQEIVDTAKTMIGNWHIPKNLDFVEILLRWGMFKDPDVIRVAYENAGIYIGKEMAKDYIQNSEGYVSTSKDSMFDRRAENYYVYCQHKDGLFINKEAVEIGDIVFLENGLMGLVVELDPIKAIVARQGQNIAEYDLGVLDVEEFCKLLKD